MWKGSGSGGANAFVTGLYNVIWYVSRLSKSQTEMYFISKVLHRVLERELCTFRNTRSRADDQTCCPLSDDLHNSDLHARKHRLLRGCGQG